MASLIYNSCIYDLARNNINFNSDTFYLMLVTSSYTPNKDTHTKRSNVTNEISGTGYTSGGKVSAVTVTLSTASDLVTILFGPVSFPASTLTARGCVYYKYRSPTSTPGLPGLDELVAYNDFGGNISSSGGTFAIAASTITLQN